MIIEYKGSLDIIVDPHTMEVVTAPFIFQSNGVLTNDKIKVEASKCIHEQTMFYGIAGLDYKWEVVG